VNGSFQSFEKMVGEYLRYGRVMQIGVCVSADWQGRRVWDSPLEIRDKLHWWPRIT
jgi:hypothetical protein